MATSLADRHNLKQHKLRQDKARGAAGEAGISTAEGWRRRGPLLPALVFTIIVTQLPGSNALAASDAVERTMEDLSHRFPKGIEYRIVYNPTVFVRESGEVIDGHSESAQEVTFVHAVLEPL